MSNLSYLRRSIILTKVVEIPIEYRPRIGEKKLRVRHGFTILKRILMIAINDLIKGRRLR